LGRVRRLVLRFTSLETGSISTAAPGSREGRHSARHCCLCSARKCARPPTRCRRSFGTWGTGGACGCLRRDCERPRLSSGTYGYAGM